MFQSHQVLYLSILDLLYNHLFFIALYIEYAKTEMTAFFIFALVITVIIIDFVVAIFLISKIACKHIFLALFSIILLQVHSFHF
jgi:hypothetical protein